MIKSKFGPDYVQKECIIIKKIYRNLIVNYFFQEIMQTVSFEENSSIINNSLDGEKDAAEKIYNFTLSAEGGTNLTFQPSRSECGTPINSSCIISPILLNNISHDVEAREKKNADISFTRFRLPTPDGSIYGLDMSMETPEQEKCNLWK